MDRIVLRQRSRAVLRVATLSGLGLALALVGFGFASRWPGRERCELHGCSLTTRITLGTPRAATPSGHGVWHWGGRCLEQARELESRSSFPRPRPTPPPQVGRPGHAALAWVRWCRRCEAARRSWETSQGPLHPTCDWVQLRERRGVPPWGSGGRVAFAHDIVFSTSACYFGPPESPEEGGQEAADGEGGQEPPPAVSEDRAGFERGSTTP